MNSMRLGEQRISASLPSRHGPSRHHIATPLPRIERKLLDDRQDACCPLKDRLALCIRAHVARVESVSANSFLIWRQLQYKAGTLIITGTASAWTSTATTPRGRFIGSYECLKAMAFIYRYRRHRRRETGLQISPRNTFKISQETARNGAPNRKTYRQFAALRQALKTI